MKTKKQKAGNSKKIEHTLELTNEIKQKEETISSKSNIERKIDFICFYLKDTPGIEKIYKLRRNLDVSKEEFQMILKKLQKRDAEKERYIVDQDEEVVVDYFTLKDYIQNYFEGGGDIPDIGENGVNKCNIPENIQKRIVNDLREQKGDYNG